MREYPPIWRRSHSPGGVIWPMPNRPYSAGAGLLIFAGAGPPGSAPYWAGNAPAGLPRSG